MNVTKSRFWLCISCKCRRVLIVMPNNEWCLSKGVQTDRCHVPTVVFKPQLEKKSRLGARLACKRLSKFVQQLTRLSNQTRPLSNLCCQRLDSQLSAIGRRFVVLLRFQNVSSRSVSVGFAEKTSVFGSV